MRTKLNEALKDAMREKNAVAVGTLRLILAALKDRDIAVRGEGRSGGVEDGDILELLARMIKQREEAIALYEQGGRVELAERERAEIDVIRGFLPETLDPETQRAAIEEVVGELGASGMRDMGRVMAELKRRYAGRMDFRAASETVKTALAA